MYYYFFSWGRNSKMQKSVCKKVLCVLLALVLAVGLVIPSLAAGAETEKTPILIVSGFTEYVLQNTETGATTFPHNQDLAINTVTAVLPSLLTLLQSNRTQADYDAFCDTALPIINGLFEDNACNPDGTVKHPEVQLQYQFPESVAEYGVETVGQTNAFDKDLLYGAVDAVGAEKVYVYGLDWRLDPMDVADELHEWISHIKDVHNCKKVSIAGISMGGVMVSAYLAKYGYSDVCNITMISAAFTGLSYVGELFKGNVQIDEKGLYTMLNQAVGTETLSKVIGSTGLVQQIIGLIDDLYAASGDRIFTECLIPAYGYNPGLWSFVPSEDFAEAKAFMFPLMDSSEAEKSALSAKVDAYHLVQMNAEKTLKAAKAAGVNVAVVSNYNFQIAPVTPDAAQTSDQVIETMHTSGYATCANIGETLPDTVKNGKYVSPDRMIDASTCYLPDETWFIKNMQHVGFDNSQNQCKFYAWLMTTDKQVNINSDAKYPQFLMYNTETKVLSPAALLRGDVNFDGYVNLVDARTVLRHIHSLQTLSALAKEAADMDANNKISHTDAQCIMDVYAGVQTVENAEFSLEDVQNAVGNLTENTDGVDNPLSGVTDKIGEIIGSLGDTVRASDKSTRVAEALEKLPAVADFALTAPNDVTEAEMPSEVAGAEQSDAPAA